MPERKTFERNNLDRKIPESKTSGCKTLCRKTSCPKTPGYTNPDRKPLGCNTLVVRPLDVIPP